MNGYTQSGTGYQSVKFEERLNNFKPTAQPTRNENGIEYTFLGWFYDIDGLEEVDFDNDTMPYKPQGSLEIFARWSSTDHTATFYDGTRNPQKLDDSKVINGYVQMPVNGYTVGEHVDGKGVFQGWQWYTGSVLSDFASDTVVREDINLYAKWKTDGFTVTYDMGVGTGNAPVDTNSYRLGDSATVGQWVGSPPAGQIFVGWTRDGDNTNTAYSPGSTVTVTGDVAFTAQYASASSTYTVTYHPNVGDGASISSRVGQGASTATLGAGAFPRDGHVLVGWTTQQNGTTSEYGLGERIPVMAPLNLYAVWEASSYVVTFKPGAGGSLTGTVRYTVLYGTALSGLTPPTPVPDDGYYFDDWSADLTRDTVTASTVVTAVFRPQTPVTITALPADKVYDGTPLSSPGYDISPTLPGVTESGIILPGSITDAGEMDVMPNIDALTLTDGGDDVAHQYRFTTMSGKLTITPVELTVTADDMTITAGDPVPAFTGDITGFVNGEDEAVLDVPPQFSTSYTPRSPAGTYDIIPEGASARNYSFDYVAGTLTVKARPATSGGSSTSRSGSDSGGGPASTTATATKTQIPASAFTWDGRTLTIAHDGISPLGLQRVLWDGEAMESYTAYRGSVLIRFDKDFIDSQPAGQHTVRAEFLNHTAETTVTVGSTGAGMVAAGTGEAGASPSDNGNHNPNTGG